VAHEALRMSLFWPPSLRICGGSHRWSLGRHLLGPCVVVREECPSR
jgi:hypothetical protein